MKTFCSLAIVLSLFASSECIDAKPAIAAPRQNVEFPGPEPGVAQASESGSVFTLENNVVSAAWRISDGSLQPSLLVDKLSGSKFDQAGRKLFRLSTAAKTVSLDRSIACAIDLDEERIRVVVSHDGLAWTELTSLERSAFPGEPKLIRIGKMSSRAEAKSHSHDGPVGEGCISDLIPCPDAIPSGRFPFKATAHEAKVAEYPFPKGCRRISCRIDKGTDQGETWGPAIALIWDEGTRFLAVGVRDAKNPMHPTLNLFTPAGEQILGRNLPAYANFNLDSGAFHSASQPRIVALVGDPNGVRVADRLGGKAIEYELVNGEGIHATWRAELCDGSNYIRQTVRLGADHAVEILGVELVDLKLPAMATVGRVPGCPIAGNGMFAGVEMPGALDALDLDSARIGFHCKLELHPKQSYEFGSVVGVAPEKQLRRAFLFYMERERARPSSPFLHYNCWYDTTPTAEHILDVARHFHEELTVKRGVRVQSYLMDDGWDDVRAGLWQEDRRKFPQGFAGLKKQVDQYGFRLGIWISPLGGYGGANERTAMARRMGLIPKNASLDLSYPKYKQWFEDRCTQLIREDGVNVFKWDRAGDGVSPHFMALLDIAHDLRKVDPELFINVTVGTWPSPFWLNHIDCTWRNGSGDVGWAGKGDNPKNEKFNRERWLTFRDGYCHELFVSASPLYPLNSVMHHGIVYGRAYQGGDMGRSNPPDLRNEARSYFANGATLQELYLSYSLMTPDAWDRVAEAARWAHANADVLVDSHWVGGNPLKLEVYGYAAWNARKGTLMLRNPDDTSKSFSFDLATVFELPPNAPHHYKLTSPYSDQRIQSINCDAGTNATLRLEPFEVLVFDANAVPL